MTDHPCPAWLRCCLFVYALVIAAIEGWLVYRLVLASGVAHSTACVVGAVATVLLFVVGSVYLAATVLGAPTDKEPPS